LAHLCRDRKLTGHAYTKQNRASRLFNSASNVDCPHRERYLLILKFSLINKSTARGDKLPLLYRDAPKASHGEASRESLRLKTLAEEKKNEQELALAQRTQESLLPRDLPSFENFEIHAFNQPTRYVGGDFYDFLQLVSGDWMGVLADVSGKGMPAALLSSMVLGAISMEFRSGTPPHEVLNRVNDLLCEKSLPAQFVTLFLFLLNPEGHGGFISAAHNPAYLYRAATGEIDELISDGYFLGMFGFATWQSRPFHLDKGDVLIVYSDRLTDAENPRQDAFGDERLLDVIRRDGKSGSAAIEKGLLTAIETFTEGTAQTDDITFVVIEKRN
jgi:sigma-B regulation protein RsbU (phosphoserine phosphatase)